MNIDRNGKCPCDSNKKYKKCCLLAMENLCQLDPAKLPAWKKWMSEQLNDREWEDWFNRELAVGAANLAEAEKNLPKPTN